jgi:hypothetical protein
MKYTGAEENNLTALVTLAFSWVAARGLSSEDFELLNSLNS